MGRSDRSGSDTCVSTGSRELIFEAAKPPKRYAQLDTGHLPHLEAPSAVADLIGSWLHD
jgi:hypothetical protein